MQSTHLPVSQYSNLFVQAHNHFKQRLLWLTRFAVFQAVVLSMGIISSVASQCKQDKMIEWASIYCLICCGKMFHNHLQQTVLQDQSKIVIIADTLGQLNQPQEQLLEQNNPNFSRAQIEKMVQSLKQQIEMVDHNSQRMGQMLVCASQIVVVIFLYDVKTQHYNYDPKYLILYSGNCNDLLLNICMFTFTTIILEYLVLYLFVAIILLSIPFLSLFLFVRRLQKVIKIRLLRRKLMSFKEVTLLTKTDPWLGGELDCRICMQEYQASEQVMKLPCHNAHHFHSTCIKEWLKISIECPLCRAKLLQVTQIELEELQQNQ